MLESVSKLPPVTIILEWENAIVVVDEWTRRAIEGLAREVAAIAPRMSAKPRIMYLYDRDKVPAGTIETVIDEVAPELGELADLEIVPTEGLSYYKLKNYGIARTRTDLAIVLDSDTVPQPGWLEGMIAPFSDPKVMGVGGFTQLSNETLQSRTTALIWIFDVKDEGRKTEQRNSLQANNFAVRTDFFRAHPFPDIQTFKKQCLFWVRGIQKEGHRYVRTAEGVTIHAPHPGLRFAAWRGWSSGMDSDFLVYQTRTKNRLARLGYSLTNFASKLGRGWYRIIAKGHVVEMPFRERPIAMILALGYFSVRLAGQIWSALTRRFEPLPPFRLMEPVRA